MIKNALPCPFCGNSELDLEEGGVDYHDDDHYESWIVVCKCGVKSPHEFYSQEQAIAFWNKRAPDGDQKYLCKKCGAISAVKNGKNKYGDQKYLCKKCGASFTDSDRKVGRPCLFDKPLTAKERIARHRAKN